MDAMETRQLETEALIEAIWGPRPADAPASTDPLLRDRQNKALATALTAYLQQYLDEM